MTLTATKKAPKVNNTKPKTTAFAQTELTPFTTPARPVSGYPIPAEVDKLLATILSWRRAHGSAHEEEFVSWLESHIKYLGYTPKRMSTEGNVVVTVPRTDNLVSTTLFSSHTDTCHNGVATKPRMQDIAYDGQRGEIFLKVGDDKVTSWGDCLGADDGAGVWLMLEMIKAKVPGTYVFHRGEERGCIGSGAMAKEEATWLKQFDVAVAFDRKGFTEVITHQGGLQCASAKCASALVAQLNANGLKGMVASPHGMLTDTKKYRDIIPECFNIAVGYYDNHGLSEYVDYAYLVALRDALIKVDWDALPVDRDPTPAPVYTPPAYKPAPTTKTPSQYDVAQEFMDMTYEDLSDYIQSFPEEAIDDINKLVIELMKTRAERDLYKNRGGF